MGLVALVGCVASPPVGDPFGVSDGGGVGSSDGASSGDSSGTGAGEGGTTVEEGDETAEGDTGDATGEPLPPFSCDAVAGESPVLDGLVIFDPAEPHPGDTLTVIVRATNGLSRADAPAMALEVTDRDGVQTLQPQTTEGGQVLYYFAIPEVPAWDHRRRDGDRREGHRDAAPAGTGDFRGHTARLPRRLAIRTGSR